MLTKESQVEVHVLHKQGKGVRAIARATGFSRNTVRALLRGKSDDRYGPRRTTLSKLDPYKEFLRARIAQAGDIRLGAPVLHREIAEQGFEGSVKIVQRFLAAIRPKPEPEPLIRFETAPGHQLQIDFVVLRRGLSPLRAFTAELGYSRYPFVEFTDNERAETLIACLERAFHWFGGVPLHVLCDNPKTIVIERDAYNEGKHKFNSKLLDFAKHCGFDIKLCAPYRAQTKGKVERFHRYFRESFFNPLQSKHAEPVDVALANREVMPWLRDVAGKRIHATLKERPVDRFQREREHLKVLPPPYGGHRRLLTGQVIATPTPIESLQHPLSNYQLFAREIAP
jgi:transposase